MAEFNLSDPIPDVTFATAEYLKPILCKDKATGKNVVLMRHIHTNPTDSRSVYSFLIFLPDEDEICHTTEAGATSRYEIVRYLRRTESVTFCGLAL